MLSYFEIALVLRVEEISDLLIVYFDEADFDGKGQGVRGELVYSLEYESKTSVICCYSRRCNERLTSKSALHVRGMIPLSPPYPIIL